VIAGGVARDRGDHVRAVADRTAVTCDFVDRPRQLGADADAVNGELDAGDADVVARVRVRFTVPVNTGASVKPVNCTTGAVVSLFTITVTLLVC
jgi:hypothetical protein